MSKHHGGRTNFASCIAATFFLFLLLTLGFVLYFSLFRLRSPRISIHAVEVPSFSSSNSTLTFSFSQYITLRNPNRAAFSHHGSTLTLLLAGNQIGFMFIPAGRIAARKTEYIAATFEVKSVPVSPVPKAPAAGVAGVPLAIEVESRIKVTGRVEILHFFAHHAAAAVDCKAAIGVKDGAVLGFHC